MGGVYYFGLFFVGLYLLLGIDDFLWDIATLIRRFRHRGVKVDLAALDDLPPKRIAILVAAWQEDGVLEDVIDHLITSMHYPRTHYDVFLGVYPNDSATIAGAQTLSARHPNVHVIVNEAPGPSSKAQNLNFMIRTIKAREGAADRYYHALSVHDAEDVVHPLELKLTNLLLEEHDALQFPVFPWLAPVKLSSFFKTLTTSVYADEFAENHVFALISRMQCGAFVPSAGTGFVLSQKALATFGDEDVFPKDSLTEDFRLALSLYQKGIPTHYVLERVWRVNEAHRVTKEFIATRSVFPNTRAQAVRQRTRWILGITMQSFRFKDVFAFRGLRLVGRYSLYKDLKAKVGNLLPLVGYPILIYFFLSLLSPLPPIFPRGTLSWYLSLCLTFLMVERQAFRAVAIFHVYGLRQALFASLFPPLLPLRLVWGNIINLQATLRAYRQAHFGASSPTSRKTRRIAWDKTEHSFLSQEELAVFHRRTGDLVLEKGFLSPGALRAHLLAFQAQSVEVKFLRYLQAEGVLTESMCDDIEARKRLTKDATRTIVEDTQAASTEDLLVTQ